MIYIKRVANADITRQIDLNKESAIFFGFNEDSNSEINLTFEDEDTNEIVSGTVKKSGHTTTIIGGIFSEVKRRCALSDIIVFSTTRDKSKFKYFIVNRADEQYWQFDKSLNLFGSHSRVINQTTHLVAIYDTNNDLHKKSLPLQQIYFGAPGTGKSFAIDGIVNKDNSVRTTFHPDSDYSTFVGCYKPIKRRSVSLTIDELINKLKEAKNGTYPCQKIGAIYWNTLQKLSSEQIKHIIAECGFTEAYYQEINKGIAVGEELSNNSDVGEITYEFVPQAFTTAYVNAWKDRNNPYFLVIEEINRGNCAQIFGDIFQLLDRDCDTGYSSYKITPDKDLQDYLATELKGCDIDDDIKSGEKMQLPSNLNILATMNTSDQSLFPIDSAFKRRWDWKYIPIDYTDNGHYIACGSNKYKWTDFLDAVNKRIESVTQSEDKKMGGWFVKPNGMEITADKFVSKVVFYLWNDVFKDFGHDGNSIFKEDFDTFHKFFDNKGDVKLDVLEKFLVSLGDESDQSSTESISAE